MQEFLSTSCFAVNLDLPRFPWDDLRCSDPNVPEDID